VGNQHVSKNLSADLDPQIYQGEDQLEAEKQNFEASSIKGTVTIWPSIGRMVSILQIESV
jgi:hypothetical protein